MDLHDLIQLLTTLVSALAYLKSRRTSRRAVPRGDINRIHEVLQETQARLTQCERRHARVDKALHKLLTPP